MHTVTFIKSWCPPVLLALYRRYTPFQIRFSGDYPDWGAALADANGYDDVDAIEAIRAAALQVKLGQAGWERDGTLFAAPLPGWPTRACLARTAIRCKGRLYVLDFGGALGTSYLQHKPFLADAVDVSWSIVEQPQLATIGATEFSQPTLHFFDNIAAACSAYEFDLVLLAGVLSYLEAPFTVLDDLIASGVSAILLDRTPTIDGSRDRLTVQKVPSAIYAASYPAWFFGEQSLLRYFRDRGFLPVAEYDCDDRANVPCHFKGFLFERCA